MESEIAASSPKRSSIVFCLLFLIQIIQPGTNIRAQAGSASPQVEKAVTSVAIQAAPWTGDFDGMLQRRFIRVLVFIPVSRDQMLPRLIAGRGDLAVGNLEITPERSKTIDFSEPLVTGVKDIAVTGPRSPVLHSIEDLSGQEVFVRKSSSYWERLVALNARFKSQGKSQVVLRPAPEDLEDEDLLEMLNAGLVRVVIAHAYLPNLWAKIYTNIRPNPDVVLDDSGQVAWAMRKESSQLMATINQFVKTHKQGTLFGNSVIGRYALNPKIVGDIHTKDANIHAGVKYIRSMIDNNFANEPMDDTNKLLFAFAAYNAGPGRIHSLREEAARQGLNPNVWIDNVEMVAAARIGVETVTYVANIYKYYIAYKLIAEQENEKRKTMDSVEGHR